MRSDEYVVGAGYTIKAVPLTLTTQTGKKTVKSDVKCRADFSIRDDRTLLRNIAEEYTISNAGKKVITLKLSADYNLSDKFTLRIFFDRIVNTPFISNSFRTANTNIGFSVKFALVNNF